MAKDLPYFKFIISEWNDGDITLCSLEAQGLFINLCSLYWSQEGNLSITKAKRRYKDCNTTVWDELIGEGIIKVDDDQIKINFLDEQFAERKGLSIQNTKNVLKRWKKQAPDTTVIRPYNDGNGSVYNKEEKREEERRKEENPPIRTGYDPTNYYQTPSEAFEEIKGNEILMEQLTRIVHQQGFRTAQKVHVMVGVKKFLTVEGAKDEFKLKPKSEVKNHLINWMNKNAARITETNGIS